MISPSVLAIVLNWKQPTVTVTCVQHLQAMEFTSLDILIIDNGSADDSVNVFQTELHDIQLLPLDDNLGFAKGVNKGIQYALDHEYDYALLINNDALASSDVLSCLLAEADPTISMLSPKIYYADDPERIWFANGRKQQHTLDLRDTGRGEYDSVKWSQSCDVDYLLGTCLLVTLSAVQKVGMLDECYFMYYEDLDWSLRMHQSGYRLRLVADAHLYHLVSLSSGGEMDTPIRRYHMARSSIIFWRTHLHDGCPILIILSRIANSIKMTIRLFLSGKHAVLRSFWQGVRDGWHDSHR